MKKHQYTGIINIMKGKWMLLLCWNLFCLLFFVSYTFKAIRISVSKLRNKGPIVTNVPAHDEHILELFVRNVDTASLIRSRRTRNSYNHYNISDFSKTTTIRPPCREPPTIRWIGSAPHQVSHAGPVKLRSHLFVPLFYSVTRFYSV